MTETLKLTRLEKFFILFLFINPFLDLLSGIYIYYSAALGLHSVTQRLIVRIYVLVHYNV